MTALLVGAVVAALGIAMVAVWVAVGERIEADRLRTRLAEIEKQAEEQATLTLGLHDRARLQGENMSLLIITRIVVTTRARYVRIDLEDEQAYLNERRYTSPESEGP